jgi:predicted glycoside hydrolase/deacetylase ChbG (UPF0249 family)
MLQKIIEFQWDKFTEACGRLPDFIDGYQHVHQLPVICDVLFAVTIKKGGIYSNTTGFAVVIHSIGVGKAKIISMLGAKCFFSESTRIGHQYQC